MIWSSCKRSLAKTPCMNPSSQNIQGLRQRELRQPRWKRCRRVASPAKRRQPKKLQKPATRKALMRLTFQGRLCTERSGAVWFLTRLTASRLARTAQLRLPLPSVSLAQGGVSLERRCRTEWGNSGQSFDFCASIPTPTTCAAKRAAAVFPCIIALTRRHLCVANAATQRCSTEAISQRRCPIPFRSLDFVAPVKLRWKS